ncbi:MAG: hypothetical protein A2009_02075 [Tenericutes bacterium GWD2_38_27]|nr:MAG: hypothetical protein A2Y43_00750 [Tenericutes bacterium GWA2_38_26]OHE32667.1 MAG: hypothetical protein A2009_02075 [Tenericutes bacterium GWD2_38_27]OHE41383.1 MAG: hypothetical protein A2102_02440 [Tenericutes bacterium GWF2_38_8]HBG33684.1 hypothetical protein [Acholeplasmataceae bacterium]HCB66816.1 hypothetical protein [Acholeplasmataceae bacterium]
MKGIALKVIVSLIVLSIAAFLVHYFFIQNQASNDGTFHLVIMDASETIVYEGDLEFFEGDTFYDVLDRNFELTTQPPTFLGIVIIGIENDEFTILTNFTDDFLAIEVYEDGAYRKTAEGAVLIEPEDGQLYRLRVEQVSEGPSS